MAGKQNGEALSREATVMRSLAKEIGALQNLNLAQLRARYLDAFGQEARSKNLPHLRKKIAFRLQEQLEGGLSEGAQQRIQELVTSERPEGSPRPARRSGVVSPFPSAESRAEGRDPRLPKAGTLVSRTFQGFVHEVQVCEADFLYRGRPYRSLSAIAKEITGTPWNGFLFFGLITRGGRDGR